MVKRKADRKNKSAESTHVSHWNTIPTNAIYPYKMEQTIAKNDFLKYPYLK